MKELYADFNDVAADLTLPLTGAGSIASIAALNEPLANGDIVWLTDGELRVQALVNKRDDGSWEARADWKLLR